MKQFKYYLLIKGQHSLVNKKIKDGVYVRLYLLKVNCLVAFAFLRS